MYHSIARARARLGASKGKGKGRQIQFSDRFRAEFAKFGPTMFTFRLNSILFLGQLWPDSVGIGPNWANTGPTSVRSNQMLADVGWSLLNFVRFRAEFSPSWRIRPEPDRSRPNFGQSGPHSAQIGDFGRFGSPSTCVSRICTGESSGTMTNEAQPLHLPLLANFAPVLTSVGAMSTKIIRILAKTARVLDQLAGDFSRYWSGMRQVLPGGGRSGAMLADSGANSTEFGPAPVLRAVPLDPSRQPSGQKGVLGTITHEGNAIARHAADARPDLAESGRRRPGLIDFGQTFVELGPEASEVGPNLGQLRPKPANFGPQIGSFVSMSTQVIWAELGEM